LQALAEPASPWLRGKANAQLDCVETLKGFSAGGLLLTFDLPPSRNVTAKDAKHYER